MREKNASFRRCPSENLRTPTMFISVEPPGVQESDRPRGANQGTTQADP
jgi:hypothetical protein